MGIERVITCCRETDAEKEDEMNRYFTEKRRKTAKKARKADEEKKTEN